MTSENYLTKGIKLVVNLVTSAAQKDIQCTSYNQWFQFHLHVWALHSLRAAV